MGEVLQRGTVPTVNSKGVRTKERPREVSTDNPDTGVLFNKDRPATAPEGYAGLDDETRREVLDPTLDPQHVAYGGRPGNGQGDDNGFDFFKKKK